ncbi:MAG: hypothetical protein IKL02_06290 [Kiritimatiellae bacterium]|nr:hypothetical protein [Kiritimatiellia bacterium]
MNTDTMKYGMIAAMAGLAGCGDLQASDTKNVPSTVNEKETVVTNANGTVTRTKRSEREIKDSDGNVIGHETSVYSETVPADSAAPQNKSEVNDPKDKTAGPENATEKAVPKAPNDSFLGLKFGEVPAGADKAEAVPGESALKMIKFTPEKKLNGFDDYYAFVSPKTHKLVKVCACAREEVAADSFGRRHYLVEALERRYGVPARLASWARPLYLLDIAPNRGVSICLADASSDYETVITAWDDDAARLAASELREMRDEAFRKAIENRAKAVNEAADAF